MISLPLKTDDRLIGAVSLYSTDAAGYSDEHLRLVGTIASIAADAIAKSKLHAEAESHALTDPMTGLPNARSLQGQFDREVARAHRSSGSFQVLMLDLDGFKQVNDTFGHKTGDKMLIEIGRVIKSQLREYDFLARYAGDEFVAIIPNTTGEDVIELCLRIEKSVEDFELVVGDDVANVGVSIGAAVYPHSGDGFDQLLIAADKEMYATKARRKLAERQFATIPRPERPLDFDMPIAVDIYDIDTVFDIDEKSVYTAAVD
jgi:diguanylate cyclase (GGDEF)-like protein